MSDLTPRSPSKRSIVADIGGTNTRVAQAEGGQLVPGSARKYRNAEFPGLEAVLRQFMGETDITRPRAAGLAMAGPVHDGKGVLTNLDWTVDTHILAESTGAETVALLNDLQAQGHALGHLPADALQAIIAGPPPNLQAAQLVIGLGTGFNAAPVYNTADGRFVPPSEAGHATLPARSRQHLDLAAFITERHGFCSIEDALSGRGIVWIYDFLCERDDVPGGLTSGEILALSSADDASPPERIDLDMSRAREAVGIFVRLGGEVVGDLALTLLPFGGVFLIGGMARAMAPYMTTMGFAEAFRDKGRFSDFMGQFAVTLVADDDAALIGSARHLETLQART